MINESLCDRKNRLHMEENRRRAAQGLPLTRKPPMTADEAREVVAEQLAHRKASDVARSLERFCRIGNLSPEAIEVYQSAIRQINS